MAKSSLSPTKDKRNGHVSSGKPKPLSEAAQRRAWRTEVDYFESIRARLFRNRQYRGKFIAVRGREIVGVGGNEFELFKRMLSDYPGEVVLIEQAAKEPKKIELPSVEILR